MSPCPHGDPAIYNEVDAALFLGGASVDRSARRRTRHGPSMHADIGRSFFNGLHAAFRSQNTPCPHVPMVIRRFTTRSTPLCSWAALLSIDRRAVARAMDHRCMRTSGGRSLTGCTLHSVPRTLHV